jgi:hypothetical protein
VGKVNSEYQPDSSPTKIIVLDSLYVQSNQTS